MKKAIGFNAGQYGDLIISTAAAKVFKERFPDSELTLGISKNFSEISPLFYNHLYFDNIHIWEGYNNWPSDIDKKYLEFKKYDIDFNAMPQHTRNDWYNYHHFTQVICLSHGFEPTENLQCNLTKWFDTIPGYENYIALSVFPGYGASNGRTFSVEKLNELVDNIHKLGYKTILIGTDKEPKLNNTETIQIPEKNVNIRYNIIDMICDDIYNIDKYMIKYNYHITDKDISYGFELSSDIALDGIIKFKLRPEVIVKFPGNTI